MINRVVKAVRVGRYVADCTFETAPGKFSHSGLLVFLDWHKVSVYKSAKLIWSTTDECDIYLITRAMLGRNGK